MCSKRVFSNSNIEVDYINYYNIKSGCEILKTIKQENNIAIINKFKKINLNLKTKFNIFVGEGFSKEDRDAVIRDSTFSLNIPQGK